MSESGARPPAIRASDAEREAVVARLQTAAGEGRLALDELAGRLDRALGAVTRSKIVVPDGVHVDLGGFAFMGGNSLRLEGAPTPPPGAPVVRVRAYSIMGGTDVRRAKRR